MGSVLKIEKDGTNVHFTLSCSFNSELKIDQSLSHNGICLTVVECSDESYVVTAIEETMQKTSLGELQIGDLVNLERCMMLGSRLDGHMVQGHVDTLTTVTDIEKVSDDLWNFYFQNNNFKYIVDKGSITINGVSLTLVNPSDDNFSVSIIRETFDRTNFNNLKVGSSVNIEFDIMAKYVERALNDK